MNFCGLLGLSRCEKQGRHFNAVRKGNSARLGNYFFQASWDSTSMLSLVANMGCSAVSSCAFSKRSKPWNYWILWNEDYSRQPLVSDDVKNKVGVKFKFRRGTAGEVFFLNSRSFVYRSLRTWALAECHPKRTFIRLHFYIFFTCNINIVNIVIIRWRRGLLYSKFILGLLIYRNKGRPGNKKKNYPLMRKAVVLTSPLAMYLNTDKPTTPDPKEKQDRERRQSKQKIATAALTGSDSCLRSLGISSVPLSLKPYSFLK